MKATIEERVAFDMYFATLCGFQMHPGAGRGEHTKKSISECRDMALEMLALRKQLFEET